MKRLPRILPSVVLACSLSFPTLSNSSVQAAPRGIELAQAAPTPAPGNDATPAPAAPATPAPAPGAETPAAPATPAPAAPAAPAATEPAATEPAAPAPEVGANQTLEQQVDDFWHYGEIGRYDLQAAYGQKLLGEGQQNPEQLLGIFEKVAANHRAYPTQMPTDLDAELLRWQAADPQMKTVATQLIDMLNKGRFARRQNPDYIKQNIQRLNTGERGYMLGMQQLRNSGELAVPQMVAILISNAPADQQMHDVVRRALKDLGRAALNPLLAATQMPPNNVALTSICGVLGDIGYPIAVPYLTALAKNPQASNEVRDAANAALKQLNADPNANPGDLFYDLAGKFYLGTASVQPDPRQPVAFMWYWVDGLTNKPVPPPIFNDLMTMRTSEQSLRLNPSQPDQAVALWLSAHIRRNIDLPQGATDPTRTPEEPQPHYYNVAEGAKYLNLVLTRALNDNTPQSPAVALAAIKSLQNIVGQSNMFSGGQGQPLVDALRYPDRQVRFEAAFAIAAALPQKPFQGQARVVPLLAEAVQQSGTPGVLIVANPGDRAKLTADLKGYSVAGGEDPSTAVADSMTVPAVDVILMSEDMGGPAIDRLFELAAANPRLERAAKLIIVHSLASPWARMSLTDPTLSYTEATGGPQLAAAVEAARKKAGGLPMDEKVATDFALRSANLLAKLAITHNPVLDLAPAEQTLIASLGDKRVEIAKAAGEAAAMLDSKAAQGGLADRANDPNTPPDVRVSLYKSLATSAKFYGNRLGSEQIGAIQQVVGGEKNLDIRSAAAEARGALNLPSEDAKSLIVQRND